MKCSWKRCENEAKPRKGGPTPLFCSSVCKSKDGVDRLRHLRKLEAIEWMGGKCVKCGYGGCPAAMHFHHTDPEHKEINISRTTNWTKITKELEKCILVCANCHAEEHWREWEPPRQIKTKIIVGPMTISDDRHGTYAGYKAGCRLECCKKANNEYMNNYNAKKRRIQ